MRLLRYRNSKGYALFLALLPIIMVYRVPLAGIGAATFAIAVGLIYAGMGLLLRNRSINWTILMPWVVYYLYVMTKSSEVNILLCITVLGHLAIISADIVDCDYLKRIIVNISMAAFFLITLQTITHYLFKIHIPMIVAELCLDDIKDNYLLSITTGFSKGSTLYRPCVFFLEPSYYAKYCSVGLGFCLFGDEKNIRKAVCISLGIILTTSGMGIVMVAFLWFLGIVGGNERYSTSKKTLLFVGMALAGVIFYFILNLIPFTHNIIARITGTSVDGYNAIHGRLFWWSRYFGSLNWRDLIFGFGETSLPEAYFTGFMSVLYAYGIVGFFLLLWALTVLMIRARGFTRILAVIFSVALFFANYTGLILTVYNIGIIFALFADDCRRSRLTTAVCSGKI